MKLPPGHFFGHRLFSRTVGDFQLMEIAYRPNEELGRHSHTHGCFGLMLEGSLTERYGAKAMEHVPFCVAVNVPDEEHSNVVHNAGARFFVVDIGREWFDRARESSVKIANSTVLRTAASAYLGGQLYYEARRDDNVSPLAIEGLVLCMLAEAGRNVTDATVRNPPLWLERAKELLHARFAESLTIAAIAQSVGVHPVHLSSMFSNYYRSSIGQYVRRLRVSYASRALAQSETPIAEIGLAAGFYDQSHFSRVFKEFTGMTPAQYRIHSRTP